MDKYMYARRWLHETAGYAHAEELIRTEAQILRVDPLSDVAIRHAIATYHLQTGKSPRRNPLPGEHHHHVQEGLLP